MKEYRVLAKTKENCRIGRLVFVAGIASLTPEIVPAGMTIDEYRDRLLRDFPHLEFQRVDEAGGVSDPGPAEAGYFTPVGPNTAEEMGLDFEQGKSRAKVRRALSRAGRVQK